jgi:hypothetical protein
MVGRRVIQNAIMTTLSDAAVQVTADHPRHLRSEVCRRLAASFTHGGLSTLRSGLLAGVHPTSHNDADGVVGHDASVTSALRLHVLSHRWSWAFAGCTFVVAARRSR